MTLFSRKPIRERSSRVASTELHGGDDIFGFAESNPDLEDGLTRPRYRASLAQGECRWRQLAIGWKCRNAVPAVF